MPVYQWICDCGEEIPVSAKIDERDIPPGKCPKCGGELRREPWQRTSGNKGFILNGDKHWHNTEYSKNRSIK